MNPQAHAQQRAHIAEQLGSDKAVILNTPQDRVVFFRNSPDGAYFATVVKIQGAMSAETVTRGFMDIASLFAWIDSLLTFA